LLVRGGEINLLHRGDQPVERDEPPAQQQPVAEHGRDQRESEHKHLAALEGIPDALVKRDQRDQERARYEQQVHGQDLGQQRARFHEHQAAPYSRYR
jgi:hypothetical protein